MPSTRIAFAIIPLLFACSPAHGGDPALWERSIAPEASSPLSDASTPTTGGVSVSFTTRSPGGEYAPDNVGAVWVENASGAYVRTLAVWGQKRIGHLVAWRAASGLDAVDAVTAATRRSHGAHVVSWNLLDRGRARVPNGAYVVRVELTDSNSSEPGEPKGPQSSFPIEIGDAPVDTTLPDEAFFISRSLRYAP